MRSMDQQQYIVRPEYNGWGGDIDEWMNNGDDEEEEASSSSS